MTSLDRRPAAGPGDPADRRSDPRDVVDGCTRRLPGADLLALPPTDWRGTAPRPIGVDEAFNGYVAANVIFALNELGVWERLSGGGAVSYAGLAAGTGAQGPLLAELLRAAADCGYLRRDGDAVQLTEAGRAVAQLRGYFTWAVGGYQEVFGSAAAIVTGHRRFGADVHRNEAMVALGSGLNDQAFLAGLLDEVLSTVDCGYVADLGSGGASRLCRVVAGRSGRRGLGLDISAPATRLAERTIATAGLADRVSALRADVLDIVLGGEHRARLSEVDTVMSFFLLHDLLADPAGRADVLPRMREAFPGARTFLLADTMLRPQEPGGEPTLPVFSLGYELAHALMGVPLHTRQTYQELFAAAGLRTERVVAFGTPHSWLYVLSAG